MKPNYKKGDLITYTGATYITSKFAPKNRTVWRAESDPVKQKSGEYFYKLPPNLFTWPDRFPVGIIGIYQGNFVNANFFTKATDKQILNEIERLKQEQKN